MWLNLRPFATQTIEIADTIMPDGDTLFLRVEIPDSTKLKDLLNLQQHQARQLPTAGLMLNFRPIVATFTHHSQYSPLAIRDTFLLKTQTLLF